VATLYDVLGISPRFSSDAIRRLRGVLAREYAETGRAPDQARMAAINAAIDVLGDDARRRAYDAEHGIEREPDSHATLVAARIVERTVLERRISAAEIDRNVLALALVAAAAFAVVAWWLGFALVVAVVGWWMRREHRRLGWQVRADGLRGCGDADCEECDEFSPSRESVPA
jgi:hypothetical protein